MGRKDWRTPLDFFKAEWERFGFNVDAAADDDNALVRDCGSDLGDGKWCEKHDLAMGRYYTEAEDGSNWGHYRPGDRVWCNPPYQRLEKWLHAAHMSSRDPSVSAFWELLLPPATDAKWFHRYVWDKRFHRPREGVEVEFLEGRLRFSHPDRPDADSPSGPNMIVRFFPEGMGAR